MRLSMPALLVIAAALTGCIGHRDQTLDLKYAQLRDKELWFAMRTVGGFNELRCQGLDPDQANVAFRARFATRDQMIDAAMLAKYGPLQEGEGEFLPIGKKCPAYRGAIRQSDAIRAELERRLGLPNFAPRR